jgi:hypothetical protein
VGLVLARSRRGPVCFSRGKRYVFPECGAGPFEGRADAALVVQGITDLMNMPSAGDFVIYGTGAAEGDVSFIPENGCHAGPSAEEMNTFIVRPAHITLAETLTHPAQLYDHFIQYHAGLAKDGTYPGPTQPSRHVPRRRQNQRGTQSALSSGPDCIRPGRPAPAGDRLFGRARAKEV